MHSRELNSVTSPLYLSLNYKSLSRLDKEGNATSVDYLIILDSMDSAFISNLVFFMHLLLP